MSKYEASETDLTSNNVTEDVENNFFNAKPRRWDVKREMRNSARQ